VDFSVFRVGQQLVNVLPGIEALSHKAKLIRNLHAYAQGRPSQKSARNLTLSAHNFDRTQPREHLFRSLSLTHTHTCTHSPAHGCSISFLPRSLVAHNEEALIAIALSLEHEAGKAVETQNRVWIIKPSTTNQGNGILVCRGSELQRVASRLWDKTMDPPALTATATCAVSAVDSVGEGVGDDGKGWEQEVAQPPREIPAAAASTVAVVCAEPHTHIHTHTHTAALSPVQSLLVTDCHSSQVHMSQEPGAPYGGTVADNLVVDEVEEEECSDPEPENEQDQHVSADGCGHVQAFDASAGGLETKDTSMVLEEDVCVDASVEGTEDVAASVPSCARCAGEDAETVGGKRKCVCTTSPLSGTVDGYLAGQEDKRDDSCDECFDQARRHVAVTHDVHRSEDADVAARAAPVSSVVHAPALVALDAVAAPDAVAAAVQQSKAKQPLLPPPQQQQQHKQKVYVTKRNRGANGAGGGCRDRALRVCLFIYFGLFHGSRSFVGYV